jgi:hypothetical protein
VLTGTVLAGTRLPLGVWLDVLTDWRRSGRPSAARLAERHGITPEAARQLLRRVDAAMARGGDDDPLGAVLGLPAAAAADVRRRTPARIRPRRLAGPTADYGAG